jgi:hypothetical protein
MNPYIIRDHDDTSTRLCSPAPAGSDMRLRAPQQVGSLPHRGQAGRPQAAWDWEPRRDRARRSVLRLPVDRLPELDRLKSRLSTACQHTDVG